MEHGKYLFIDMTADEISEAILLEDELKNVITIDSAATTEHYFCNDDQDDIIAINTSSTADIDEIQVTGMQHGNYSNFSNFSSVEDEFYAIEQQAELDRQAAERNAQEEFDRELALQILEHQQELQELQELQERETQNRRQIADTQLDMLLHSLNYSHVQSPISQQESYEELMALQERIGNVNTGLSSNDISRLPDYPYNGDNSSEKSCPICLLDYQKSVKLTILSPCFHIFHHECCIKWLKQNKKCPVCREPVSFE